MANEARKAAVLRALERFVVRARLVQEHSLAADLRVLEKHAAWEMTFSLTYDPASGKRGVTMKPAALLPTEQVESAAARVRPLFLMSDGVHYDKVLNALGEAVSSAAVKKEIEALRADFRVADPDYPNSRTQHDQQRSRRSLALRPTAARGRDTANLRCRNQCRRDAAERNKNGLC